MAINLMNIKPHKVSRDLSTYITYIYGPAGTGKTTLASQMEKSLLLAFERGYNAIPGIMAQDISTWGEMKQVVRELKKQEIKDTFRCIVVDTVDIAAALCEKYICGQLGIENIGDGGWSVNGWAKVKREFEEVFRTISQLGYSLFFISHSKDKTFKKQDGTEYNQIVTSLSTAYDEIIKNMVDIFGYAHPIVDENGNSKVMLTLRSGDNSVDAKSRFKYIKPEIEFNYQSLEKAINDAIDEEERVTQNKNLFTNERNTIEIKELNYEEIKNKFDTIVTQIIQNHTDEEMVNTWSPKITQITEKYLGKGKKASQCTEDQKEQLNLIVIELEELIKE